MVRSTSEKKKTNDVAMQILACVCLKTKFEEVFLENIRKNEKWRNLKKSS